MSTRSRPPLPDESAKPLNPCIVWLAGLILTTAIVLAYGGTLTAPFVYDDLLAIPENQTIRQLWPLTAVLWPQAAGGLTVSGRPVLNLSFALNHAISGTQVWSYHVFNILLHVGTAWLLFGLARRTIEKWHGSSARPAAEPVGQPGQGNDALLAAFALTALWSLHPLLTQAVTYTVQRAESMMGFFYLLTLYAFVRGARSFPDRATAKRDGRGWLGLSIASCLLGMGTKEVMATAPLTVLLFDRTFISGSFSSAWRARRAYYLGLAGTWVILAILVFSTGGNRGGTVGLGTGVPLWAYPLTQFEAVARYLALALWPHPLIFEYGTFWVERAGDVLPYAIIVGPLLVGTVVAVRYRPALGFCGAWFFLILAPTSLAPGTIQMIVEHRMYLPLVAVIAPAVCGVQRRVGRHGMTLALVAAVAFGTLTYRRNQDYRTQVSLWSDTIAKRRGNPRAHDGLAEAFTKLGRIDHALIHRREAVRLLPSESRYHFNLAMTLTAANRPDEAIQHYQLSLQLAPDEARTHNNLAILFGERGDDRAALAHYAEAVRLKPAEALFHYNHGVALLRNGRLPDAIRAFETALQLRPNHADAHVNLAAALVRSQRIDSALAHYTEAVRLQPDTTSFRSTLAGALLVAGRPGEALEEFQRVLASQPGATEAALGVGKALAALGRTKEAAAQYESVLLRDPGNAAAHFKLADTLLDLDQVPRAVEHYQAGLRGNPADAEAHHNLGVAYARLEQWAEARVEFETALRLKPDYTDAQRNLEQLKSLLGR